MGSLNLKLESPIEMELFKQILEFHSSCSNSRLPSATTRAGLIASELRSLLNLPFAVKHELRLDASKFVPKIVVVETAGLLLRQALGTLSEGLNVKLKEPS